MQGCYIETILKRIIPCIDHLTYQLDYVTITLRTITPLILNSLPLLFQSLKKSTLLRFSVLTELTSWDSLGGRQHNSDMRFIMVYILTSWEYNIRLFIKYPISTKEIIPSVSGLYFNAGWSEREAAEMFGLLFKNNVDLRRLLTDYGFQGFPLRRDFPLSGYFEIRYDEETSKIITEPVQLTQEYRVFSLVNPGEKG